MVVMSKHRRTEAASRRGVLRTTRGKLLVSAAVVGTAAAVAGLGTFGAFTSTTSASATAGSGTVNIALGANGPANRLSVAATGIVPGDTIQRAVTLSNTGNQALAAITLTTAATTSSLLDTNTTMGLQVRLQDCSVPWTEAGTAPGYTYTCSGTTTTVLAQRAIIGSNLALTGMGALTAGAADNLLVTMTFPAAADNTLQGQSSVIGFTFTGTQRVAANK